MITIQRSPEFPQITPALEWYAHNKDWFYFESNRVKYDDSKHKYYFDILVEL